MSDTTTILTIGAMIAVWVVITRLLVWAIQSITWVLHNV